MLSHDAGQQPRPLVMVHLARVSSQHYVHCCEIGRSDKAGDQSRKEELRSFRDYYRPLSTPKIHPTRLVGLALFLTKNYQLLRRAQVCTGLLTLCRRYSLTKDPKFGLGE
jgi:hypothetical protein